MDKRKATLDRWHRLGFGRRSSPSSSSQEKSKKSSDKSEKLKELTELLRKNRSSPVPPPVPPPRKARLSASASNSIEKYEELNPFLLSKPSDDIVLINHGDQNIDLPNLETFYPSRTKSPSPTPNIKQSSELNFPKGVPFRSSSFSQIDYSSGKYIGSTINALRERLRRDKVAEKVVNKDLEEEKCEDKPKIQDSFVYIPLRSSDKNDICLQKTKTILEEDNASEDKEFETNFLKDKGKADSTSTKNVEKENLIFARERTQEEKNTQTIDFEILSQPSTINELSEVLESNLATFVEEEVPLEYPPENFLQTATTCLIPEPVYECAAQDWNSVDVPQEWVDVAVNEFETCAVSPVISDSQECEQLYASNGVPTISVSQYVNKLVNLEEAHLFSDDKPQTIASKVIRDDFLEVKKRLSHDETVILCDKSSLDCILQRTGSVCNKIDEKKRIDKSKRRKGMYIECTDWGDTQEIRKNKALNLDISFISLDSKSDRSALTESDCFIVNTPKLEYHKPTFWTQNSRQTSLSCPNPDEKSEDISIGNLARKSLSFLCTESVSDSESDRTTTQSRDRSSPSPALSDQDFKRYSKRPLRGPYGQMLEEEMKKPNRLHFEEILEELKDPDLYLERRSRESFHDSADNEYHSRTTPHYSNSFRVRKSNTYLPVPTHTRAASTPSQIENIKQTGLLKINPLDKRYQSTCDNSVSSPNNSLKTKHHAAPLLAKSSSLLPTEKKTRGSMDEINIFQKHRSPSDRIISIESTETDFHGKKLMPTPELLAQLLKGASEKLVSEQRQQIFTVSKLRNKIVDIDA